MVGLALVFGIVTSVPEVCGQGSLGCKWGDEGPVLLFGADRLGRDVFSRILYGARISLSVGLVGIFFTFVFGMILGGLSGYRGGFVDTVIQRLVDLLISIPAI